MKWVNRGLGFVAGVLFLLAAEVAWVLDAGFIVKKSDAEYRRNVAEAYDRMAVDPIDEFAGLEEGAWSK